MAESVEEKLTDELGFFGSLLLQNDRLRRRKSGKKRRAREEELGSGYRGRPSLRRQFRGDLEGATGGTASVLAPPGARQLGEELGDGVDVDGEEGARGAADPGPRDGAGDPPPARGGLLQEGDEVFGGVPVLERQVSPEVVGGGVGVVGGRRRAHRAHHFPRRIGVVARRVGLETRLVQPLPPAVRTREGVLSSRRGLSPVEDLVVVPREYALEWVVRVVSSGGGPRFRALRAEVVVVADEALVPPPSEVLLEAGVAADSFVSRHLFTSRRPSVSSALGDSSPPRLGSCARVEQMETFRSADSSIPIRSAVDL